MTTLVEAIKEAVRTKLDEIADVESALDRLRTIEHIARTARRTLLAADGRPEVNAPRARFAFGSSVMPATSLINGPDAPATMAGGLVSELTAALPHLMGIKKTPTVVEVVEAAARAKEANMPDVAAKILAQIDSLRDADVGPPVERKSYMDYLSPPVPYSSPLPSAGNDHVAELEKLADKHY